MCTCMGGVGVMVTCIDIRFHLGMNAKIFDHNTTVSVGSFSLVV